MATQKLTNSDFSVVGATATLTEDGGIYLNNVKNQDYNTGIVSNDTFDLSVNKSVVFLFKADPYVETELPIPYWFSGDEKIYINNEKKLIVNEEEKVSFDEINFQSLKLDGSLTNKVALINNNVYVYGDNSNGQIDNQPDNVVDIAAGDGFIAYIYKNTDENKNIVVVNGKSAGNNVSVPDTVNDYDSSTDAPVKIFAGSDFIIIKKANGKISIWGDGDYSAVDTTLTYKTIKAFKNSLTLIDTDNNLYFFNFIDGTVNTESEVQDAQLANGKYYIVSLNGVVKIYNEEEIELSLKYPVWSFVDENGNYLFVDRDNKRSGISLDVIAYQENINNKQAFAKYPELARNDIFNVVFGVQTHNVSPDVVYGINSLGEQTPVITGSTEKDTVFETLANNVKGYCIVKHPNGADLAYNFKAQPKNNFLIDGFSVIPEEFLSFDNNIYKLVISFTPFGKSLRLFKSINGNFVEIKTKMLSVEEPSFETGKLAVYIKGASSFELLEAEITDELNTSLLPEEIIYRDIDTAVLQTKVAESMNKHVEAIKSISNTLTVLADKFKTQNQNNKAKFEEIENRLSQLEGNN